MATRAQKKPTWPTQAINSVQTLAMGNQIGLGLGTIAAGTLQPNPHPFEAMIEQNGTLTQTNIALKQQLYAVTAQMMSFLMALDNLAILPGLPGLPYSFDPACLNDRLQFDAESKIVTVHVPPEQVKGIMAGIKDHAYEKLPTAVKALDENAKVLEREKALLEQVAHWQRGVEIKSDFIRGLKQIPGVKAWLKGIDDACGDHLCNRPWASLNADGQKDTFMEDDEIENELDRKNWLEAYMAEGLKMGWPKR